MSMQKTGKEINRKINQGKDLQSKDRMPKTKIYKKNELIILEITDLTEEGQGEHAALVWLCNDFQNKLCPLFMPEQSILTVCQ